MAPKLRVNAKFEIRADVYNFFTKLNINPNSIDVFLGSVNPDGTLNGAPNADFGVAGSARWAEGQSSCRRASVSDSPSGGCAPMARPPFPSATSRRRARELRCRRFTTRPHRLDSRRRRIRANLEADCCRWRLLLRGGSLQDPLYTPALA
jgi:hypothetical protein